MMNSTTSGFNSKRPWPEPPLATRCGDSHRVGSDPAMAYPPLSTRLVRAAVTYRLLCLTQTLVVAIPPRGMPAGSTASTETAQRPDTTP